MRTTIDLNLVTQFLKVTETGSFTAAARALATPKSSISRGIARLEESLGVRLLQRTTRRLTLTAAGDVYFRNVKTAMASLDEANATVADLSRSPRGLVRITAAPDMGEGPLSHSLAVFLARHPGIQIEASLTGRRVDLVKEGFDLALRAGTLDDSSLVARKLFESSIFLYAAPIYLEKRGRPRRLTDLLKHDCIRLRGDKGLLPFRFKGPNGAEQVDVPGLVVADDMNFVRQMILCGSGIGVLPEVGIHREVASGALVRVLPAYSLPGAAVYLVSPPLQHVPTRVALLREHLIKDLPARYRAGTI